MFEEFKKVHDVFRSSGIEDPISETLNLFNILSGGALNYIDKPFLDSLHINLSQVAQERKEGIPLEYIIGRASFAGFDFDCSNDTLIPTECTKLLVEVTLDFIEERQQSKRQQTVIEVGTGCGNVAVLLALLTEDVKIIASDISPEAIGVARKNVYKYNLSDSVRLLCGDIFSPLRGLGYETEIDIVVCNPPYIPTELLNKLRPEIVEYQPRIALDGGPYGISFFQRLANEAIRILKPGGILIFEIGERQERLAARILSRHGIYRNIQYFKDNDGYVKVISAFKNSVPHT
ncbi:MAG TPA: peptide chain release factor N(5)-glutamine methyltransferase [Dehalococcoidia bacterium]|nr:peptide chain release factor N(5)-glutamine methyltransferase [Dehalococcoidia bacterium]